MSWMIVELENEKQNQSLLRHRLTRPTNQRMVLPEPATHIRSCQMLSGSGRCGGGAHVFHKSREVQKLLISNPGRYCLEKTMWRFLRDEHCMQCYGS